MLFGSCHLILFVSSANHFQERRQCCLVVCNNHNLLPKQFTITPEIWPNNSKHITNVKLSNIQTSGASSELGIQPMILFEFVSSWVNLAFVPYCQTFNQLRRRPPSNSVFISDVHIWKINILSGALKQDLKYFLFSWAGMKSPGEANHILELKISTRKRNLRSLETWAPRMQVTWIHTTLKDCKESGWKYNCKY